MDPNIESIKIHIEHGERILKSMILAPEKCKYCTNIRNSAVACNIRYNLSTLITKSLFK